MKRIHWTLITALLCSIFFTARPVQANAPQPGVQPIPRVAPGFSPLTSQPDGTSTNLVLPMLKAVLIVGPIDGDTGSWTTQEISNMELAAAALEKFGVDVHRFYTPNTDWSLIKQAASGAQFLLYRGHGVSWGNTNPITVGGFDLGKTFVSSDQIRTELHLAQNAIVMLYGCYTAGSSGTEAISSAEAQRRVLQYSQPFMASGAAGYFADWYGDAFEKWVDFLFSGKTLQDTYSSFYDTTMATVEQYRHPDFSQMYMWLDKEVQGSGGLYDNAFVGKLTVRLVDLFGLSTEGLQPRVYLPVMREG